MEFISLKEASKLYGCSSMSVRRLAFKIRDNENPEVANNFRIVLDKNPTGQRYEITKEILSEKWGEPKVIEEVKEEVRPSDNGEIPQDNRHIKGLTGNLTITITALTKELDNKQRTIDGLNQRLKETHILLIDQPRNSNPAPNKPAEAPTEAVGQDRIGFLKRVFG